MSINGNALQEAAYTKGQTCINNPEIGSMLSLNAYETRVYMTLLRNGTSSASQVSLVSRVPQSKVYETMGALRAKGFVLSIPSKPMKFQIVDPDATFSCHIKRCERQIQALKTTLKTIKQSVSTEKPEKQDLFVGQGEDLYRKKAIEMMKGSKAAKIVTARLVRSVEFDEAVRRLRYVKIITNEADVSPCIRYYRKFAKVKSRGEPSTGFVATEDEVLLVLNGETKTFLRTASKPIVTAVNQYFEQLWGSWQPLSRKGEGTPLAMNGRR